MHNINEHLRNLCTRQFSLYNLFGLALLQHKKIIPGKSRVNSVLNLYQYKYQGYLRTL